MTTSKAATAFAVYESMRKLGRDAMVRKEWAAAECYGYSALRLIREINEAKRTIYPDGGEDRAQS